MVAGGSPSGGPGSCAPGANPWVEAIFKDCIYTSQDAISFALGLVALAMWVVAQLPQFISNARNQSADALSILFITHWLLGDSCNLIGCILQGEQLPTTTFLAAYFVMADLVMFSQYYYYDFVQSKRRLQLLCSLEQGDTSVLPELMYCLDGVEVRGMSRQPSIQASLQDLEGSLYPALHAAHLQDTARASRSAGPHWGPPVRQPRAPSLDSCHLEGPRVQQDLHTSLPQPLHSNSQHHTPGAARGRKPRTSSPGWIPHIGLSQPSPLDQLPISHVPGGSGSSSLRSGRAPRSSVPGAGAHSAHSLALSRQLSLERQQPHAGHVGGARQARGPRSSLPSGTLLPADLPSTTRAVHSHSSQAAVHTHTVWAAHGDGTAGRSSAPHVATGGSTWWLHGVSPGSTQAEGPGVLPGSSPRTLYLGSLGAVSQGSLAEYGLEPVLEGQAEEGGGQEVEIRPGEQGSGSPEHSGACSLRSRSTSRGRDGGRDRAQQEQEGAAGGGGSGSGAGAAGRGGAGSGRRKPPRPPGSSPVGRALTVLTSTVAAAGAALTLLTLAAVSLSPSPPLHDQLLTAAYHDGILGTAASTQLPLNAPGLSGGVVGGNVSAGSAGSLLSLFSQLPGCNSDDTMRGALTLPWWCDSALLSKTIGLCLGYAAMVIHIGSRFPQIYHTWSRRSSEGLSVAMFLLAVSANICTGCSILLRVGSREALFARLPWLANALGTVGLDSFIIYLTLKFQSPEDSGTEGGTTDGDSSQEEDGESRAQGREGVTVPLLGGGRGAWDKEDGLN